VKEKIKNRVSINSLKNSRERAGMQTFTEEEISWAVDQAVDRIRRAVDRM